MKEEFVLKGENVILRTLDIKDVDRYINWYTVDREWEEWDAPWEKFNFDEESIRLFVLSKIIEERKSKLKKFLQVCTKDGLHIGWVNAYFLKEDTEKLAVGITLPPVTSRGKGYGEEGLRLFINYLNQSFQDIYMETWTGNIPMMRVGDKLGFKEVYRVEKFWSKNNIYYDRVTYKLSLKE